MGMEIDVLEKHDNLLLERTEVKARIKHPKETTPGRKALSDAMRENLGLKKEVVIVDSMETHFGKDETMIFVKVYKSIEKAREIEAVHMLKRNGLWEEPKKKKEGEG
ncbi:MAG: 30S ribosomal protein S24e [Thermoplasmatota archaeon]